MSIINSVQTVLSSSISDETTNRTNADNNLQNQINGKATWAAFNSCVRLTSFQICFGVSNGSSNITVNFPQPFKYIPCVLTTVLNPQDTGGSAVASKVSSRSTTQFVYNTRTGGGSAAASSYQTMWIAVGWWA